GNYRRLANNPAVLQYDGRGATPVGILKSIRFGVPMLHKGVFRRLLMRLHAHAAFQRVFEFPYDWRESISETARWLGSTLELAFGTINRPSDVRFTLVTHSMGGLVARVALVDGHIHPDNVRTLVHIGTPLRGSASAFRSLHREALPFLYDFVWFCQDRKN